MVPLPPRHLHLKQHRLLRQRQNPHQLLRQRQNPHRLLHQRQNPHRLLHQRRNPHRLLHQRQLLRLRQQCLSALQQRTILDCSRRLFDDW